MTLERYTADKSDEWDEFVAAARNSTFLFRRAYMDYHADRFADHSLMFRSDKGDLLALLPANVTDSTLYSHQGLTYGGLVLSRRATMCDVLAAFECLTGYMREHGLQELVYKSLPTIYHSLPSQEEEYALWRSGARLTSCLISSCVQLHDEHLLQLFRKNNRYYFNRLLKAGYLIKEQTDVSDFWSVLNFNLWKHHAATPVHSSEEMNMLMARFPSNIKHFVCLNLEGRIEAGTVLYISGGVVHTQYLSASEEGRQSTAMNFLLYSLIMKYRDEGRYQYFDFGSSNEDGGHYLNETLIAQKEGFGGRGVALRTYSLSL